MSTENTNLAVFENTRRITVRLAQGITAERFAELLNERFVKIEGSRLTNGYDDSLLGELVLAVNTSDYKVPADQCPIWELDTLDPYKFGYNQI